jgi:hypothetical protein
MTQIAIWESAVCLKLPKESAPAAEELGNIVSAAAFPVLLSIYNRVAP